ncbi:MAG: ATP-binding cassette domain-containing protein [Armatimonadetes bacterium]|nr:ATP-binding cassette domain-containing protein [Armatimonadota bacterium]
MVRTHDIAKVFMDSKRKEVRAVDGVSIEAKPGEIFGLLGANGAGKTTLLRLLSTVISPTAGSAEVAGYDVQQHPEKVRENIGFLSTSTAIYQRLTGREFIEFFGRLNGLDEKKLKERVEYVTEMFRIHEFMDSLCDKLSTGQKQRINIARTILHDPPVLFFDEPTAGLDVMTSQSVLGFIEHCRTMGKTVIFSTHIMSEVERLCDHVAVIHEGQVRAEGTVSDLLTKTGEPSLEKAFLNLVGWTAEA